MALNIHREDIMQDTVRPGDVDWTGDNPFI